jgi:hypothetical protein
VTTVGCPYGGRLLVEMKQESEVKIAMVMRLGIKVDHDFCFYPTALLVFSMETWGDLKTLVGQV